MTPDYAALEPRTCWKREQFPMLAANPNAISFGFFVQPGKDPLRAIVSIDLHDDNAGHWLHISVSRERRLPTWGDLCTARDALGYKERVFVQLVPPASAWLNDFSHCLHLQHRLDAETISPSLWQQSGLSEPGQRYGKRGTLG